MDLSHDSTRLIIDTCLKHGLLRNQCAYVLGTAWHESGRYKYMREIWGPTPAQKRYEGRKDLGNTVAGDGRKFLGRGFVQITGCRNYTDWGRRLGLDLLKEPQLAERPDIAARIIVEGMKLGTFTGKKLEDYVTLQKSDFAGARRIVNGLDRAELIAGYAREFDALLKAAGYGMPNAEDALRAQRMQEEMMRQGKVVLTPANSTPASKPEPMIVIRPEPIPAESATGFRFWLQLIAKALSALFSRNKGH